MKTFLLTVTLFLAGTLAVMGTTIPKMDLEALVNGSDRILQGKVEASDVVFDERLGVPFTRVRVRVDDPICQRSRPGVRCQTAAGDRRTTVLLRHVGGRYEIPGRPGVFRTVAASGIPQFRDGQNVIVFLRDLGDDTFQCVGLTQGKYEVIGELAVANITGVELVDPKTGRVLPAGFVEKAPIEAFKAKIRELLR